jgi:asparagine synthase (glutamine-hydrolysing)
VLSGIVGLIHFSGPGPDLDEALQLANGVGHRGPDDKGRWSSGPAVLCHRGFRRRADAEAQPARVVVGGAERMVVVDGEVEGGLSALVRAVIAGESVSGLGGSFAALVWDPQDRRLVAVRSAEGARPLVWSRKGERLALCSEIPPLLGLGWVSRSLAVDHLAEYLSFRYVHAPRTLLREIWSVPPGHSVIFDARGERLVRHAPPRWYAGGPALSPSEAVSGLDRALRISVERALQGDKPQAVLLSGGLDSTAIVHHCRQFGRIPPAFTVALEDDGVDETSIAARVAKVLGAEHHMVRVDARTLIDGIGECTRMMGQPLPSPAAILQHALFRQIRSSARVILSGDGGDEVLGGRTMGFLATRLRGAQTLGRLPGPLRNLSRRLLDRAGFKDLAASAAHFGRERGIGGSRVFHSAERVEILRDPGLVRPGIRRTVLEPLYAEVVADPINEILHVWQRGWLPEDSLARSDRMSAALGMEVRFPMLDQEMRNFTASLPGDLKVRPRPSGWETKWPLRESLRPHIPAQLLDRPKRALPGPLDAWLRGPGRELLRGCIDTMRTDPAGLFLPGALSRLEKEHVENRANHGLKLWTLLLFSLWRREVGV